MTRVTACVFLMLLLSALSGIVDGTRDITGSVLQLPSEAYRFFRPGAVNGDDDPVGTRWAVLIAGSNGYWNYRHQVTEILLNYQNFLLCVV